VELLKLLWEIGRNFHPFSIRSLSNRLLEAWGESHLPLTELWSMDG
jgi:hypothetical protein